ncbi:hypothetical protein EDC01DRAFT_469090 [Geopyxis carbonaria]|nr:hypothetical protein EDC01DRAFT_469090 [Geopyxis carbonaria]
MMMWQLKRDPVSCVLCACVLSRAFLENKTVCSTTIERTNEGGRGYVRGRGRAACKLPAAVVVEVVEVLVEVVVLGPARTRKGSLSDRCPVQVSLIPAKFKGASTQMCERALGRHWMATGNLSPPIVGVLITQFSTRRGPHTHAPSA